MSTVDFNSLIYTASKSLKKSEVSATPEVHTADINTILQDKMLTTVQHKDVFKQEMSIKSWLFQVLAKTFQPHPEIYSNNVISTKENNLTNHKAVTPESDQLQSSMNELDNALLLPFMMHFQGYKMEEIAADLNLPLDTVNNRVFEARMFLVNKMSTIS